MSTTPISDVMIALPQRAEQQQSGNRHRDRGDDRQGVHLRRRNGREPPGGHRGPIGEPLAEQDHGTDDEDDGSPSWAPYCGNQLTSPCSLVNDDCTMPIVNPVITVGQIDRKRPTMAAPSAGMRNPNVNTVDDNWIIGDAMITMNAPSTDEPTKLPAASNAGE